MKVSVLFASFLLTVSFAGQVYSQSHSIPKELLEIAKVNACNEVVDFFNRPGMVKPPYVYGYLPGAEENSAVFWCEKEKSGSRSFFLIFMTKGDNQGRLKCPEKIEWHNFPGGLVISKKVNETLKGFQYLKDSLKRLPENDEFSGNAILSEYDGVEALFYCYKGEWVVRMKD